MFNEFLSILLKTDPPKQNDAGFKHPWTSIYTTKRDVVVTFCKKYPWTVNQDFLMTHHLDIISPFYSSKIESLMLSGSWKPLYDELNVGLPPDKFYPTNYWERLADLTNKDFTAIHIFVEIMMVHGFKFTPGVIEYFLSNSSLHNQSRKIVLHKIEMDKKEMLSCLTS